MNFKAKMIDGRLEIQPIIEKKGKDIIVHVPTLELINKFKESQNEKHLESR